MTSIEDARRRYAEAVCATVGVSAGPLLSAFSSVPRERFLGEGPWQIAVPMDPANPYRPTPDANPEHVYQDVAIAIDPKRLLNNGHPSSHAIWLLAAGPQPGESVLHVGCATGYFSAILAEMVGPTGHVTAVEVEPDLASRARECLSPWPHVSVLEGDASEVTGEHDVLYVNAGATHPRPSWLSTLREGGRLILPITTHVPGMPLGVGFVVRIERAAARWPARFVSPIGIYDCAGARNPAAEPQIRALLGGAAANKIRAARTDPHERGPECLVHVEGFCLQGGAAPSL
ncbi:MAG: methyltransferase domain-containing protein [Polyangiaceae bacterium]